MKKTKKNSIFDFLKSILSAAIFVGLFVVLIQTTHAQSLIGEGWDQYLQNIPGFSFTEASGEELASDFVINLVRITRNIVGVVAMLVGILYGLRLVMGRGQEDTITKQKTNFLWLAVGFVVLIISENVASIFNPERATSAALVDFDAARDQLRDIVDYIKWLLGSAIVLYMVTIAYRMITGGADEEEIGTQKKSLTWGLVGILVILLASNIVNIVYVIQGSDEVVAADTSAGISEITGLIKLILVFLGPMAVIFTLYAGFRYLTALENEDQATSAKRMIAAGIVSIVIIYGAYALVNTFTSEDLSFFFSSYFV